MDFIDWKSFLPCWLGEFWGIKFARLKVGEVVDTPGQWPFLLGVPAPDPPPLRLSYRGTFSCLLAESIQGRRFPRLTRFLIAGSWGFSNFRLRRRWASSDFLLKRGSSGGFGGRSSDFLRGDSSHSTFRLGTSGTASLFSRFIFCSLSKEPGRLEAYLNPGPRFCLYARKRQNTQANFISYAFFSPPLILSLNWGATSCCYIAGGNLEDLLAKKGSTN